jgi:3-hydroxymyristoyl/3-hydroxydecanoyl-(acyl carrier protein) dehydratase
VDRRGPDTADGRSYFNPDERALSGHFPERAVMPGTLIVEAFGRAASILFTWTHDLAMQPARGKLRFAPKTLNATRSIT